MRAAFLELQARGVALTKEDLAKILNVTPDYVRRHSKPPNGFIPRIPHLRQLRFDPQKMIEVFCDGPLPEGKCSLTKEKRNFVGNQSKGFHKCL